MIDYINIIEDLNADIFDTYGETPIIEGFKYSYSTDGDCDRVYFKDVEVFNSEHEDIENGGSWREYTIAEFEDMLEDRVRAIGEKFLQYSFYKIKDL